MHSIPEAQAQAARKFSQAMSQQKPRMRPMEAVWFLIALTLLIWHLEATDLAHKTYERKTAACERNTTVAVAALNGWQIQEGDTKVACKRIKS
jgi:hypothetical protein